MRPRVLLFLCLPPLALAAATLYPLARGNLGRPEQQQLTEPWPLMLLDPDAGEIRWAVRRREAKRQVTCALIDGRLTLRQAAAQFRDLDADSPDKARHWRPPEYTEEEWPYRQVIAYVRAEFEANRRAPAQAQEWVARLEAELRGGRQPEGASPPATGP
jgi:hypothetical protein